MLKVWITYDKGDNLNISVYNFQDCFINSDYMYNFQNTYEYNQVSFLYNTLIILSFNNRIKFQFNI